LQVHIRDKRVGAPVSLEDDDGIGACKNGDIKMLESQEEFLSKW
jgi:hypothetical protein